MTTLYITTDADTIGDQAPEGAHALILTGMGNSSHGFASLHYADLVEVNVSDVQQVIAEVATIINPNGPVRLVGQDGSHEISQAIRHMKILDPAIFLS